MTVRPPSASAGALFATAADRAELAALCSPRMTAAQEAFCRADDRFLLWRGGNSIGKSWAHAWDTIHFARGSHPWKPRRPGPVKIMLLGYSLAQMDPLLEKLWMLLPKGEIDPKLYRQEGNGIRGLKEMTVPFVRGPGAGSAIYIATYEQGASRVMGFQGHRLGLDEPPPASVYGEARPRLNALRGHMRITMTPTPESPPLAYLVDEVRKAKLREMQTSYNVAATTILGGLVPWSWKTAAEIEEDLAGYLADERPMREHGAWEPVLMGRWLELITEQACMVEEPLPSRSWTVAVSIDHGTRPGRQSATLVVRDAAGEVRIQAEARTGEVTSTRDDARNILAMLAKENIRWHEVDHWVGDRATSDSFWGDAKSNQDLQAELAAQLGLSAREAAHRGLRIETAFKNRNSVRRGAALLNDLARKGLLKIHRQARGFWEAAKQWRGDRQSELKDPFDSARYGVMRLLDAAQAGAVPASAPIE